MKIARLTLSDRASAGTYADESGPEIERIAASQFAEPLEWIRLVLPDERVQIERALCRLADEEQCPLILTTGGTGPAVLLLPQSVSLSLILKLWGCAG